jgi:hypothetical protein
MIFQGAQQVGLKTESECKQNWGTSPLLERTPTVQSPKFQAERGCLTEFCSDIKSATRGSKLYILKAAYHQGMMDHQAVFGTIACLTQLSFENKEHLFFRWRTKVKSRCTFLNADEYP